MIFEQSLLNNFCDNFLFHTLIILLFSLYYFCPIRKEENRLSIELFDFGCPNITLLKIYPRKEMFFSTFGLLNYFFKKITLNYVICVVSFFVLHQNNSFGLG